ncbi:glycine cleavage T C-terminal barrel domain-containing protein, partial [Mesorhizobium sp.]
FLPDGTPIGQVSSGAYGYFVDQSLAMGYVKAGTAKAGDKVTVAILGRPHDAVLLAHPPFDPEGKRLRS